ncbi:24875_t:CDS:2, partial [Gigaspora rosea]
NTSLLKNSGLMRVLLGPIIFSQSENNLSDNVNVAETESLPPGK